MTARTVPASKELTMSELEGENIRLAGLIQAINDDDREAVDRWIRSEKFTLVAMPSEDGDEDALSALVVETEEFPAVVAFLDTESASQFVDSISDQIEGESVDLFEVDGEALLGPLSEDFGLVINPESDDAIMVDPSLLHDFDEDEDEDDEDDEDDDFEDEDEDEDFDDEEDSK